MDLFQEYYIANVGNITPFARFVGFLKTYKATT